MDFNRFKYLFEKKEVVEFQNNSPDSPLVSVCIQTYNHVDFIEEALDGILSQKTNFQFEILLGDDGSLDGTRELCIKFAERYPEKIRLFLHHRENNIQVASKPTGIFNSLYNVFSSKGQFIAYCDGDDIWTDQYKLQKQIEYLKSHPKVVVTYHKIKLIDETGNYLSNYSYFRESEKDFSEIELKQSINQPPTSTWCFRNLIRDIPPEFIKVINADNFWISLLGQYGSGKFIEEIKPSFYRIHSGALWNSTDKEKKLEAKRNTYFQMSSYYRTTKNHDLAIYFQKRAQDYSKMLLIKSIKDIRILRILKNLSWFLKVSKS